MTALRRRTYVVGVFLPALLLAAGCDSGTGVESPDPQPTPSVVPYTPGIRVSWDARTRVQVEDGASYARMVRLDSGDLLVGYDRDGRIYVRRSSDEGRSWSGRHLVAEASAEGVSAANAELTKLDNGTLLLAYNVRAWDNPNRRFALKVKESTDGGWSWNSRATVFEAGLTGNRGVWEPVIRQLPSGALQLYAANEYPYADSDDQEITMWRSADQGRTWSEGTTISYRAGYRDGMPVPLLLDDGGIALAIEDNGLGGPFKPAIVESPSVEEAWSKAPIDGDSENRRRALADAAQLLTPAYGGAPYLVQFPQGETLLSFQSTEGRTQTGDHVAHSTMSVAIGTPSARSFSRTSRPFDVPSGDRAVWNSLFVKDSTTVTAVTTTTAFTSAERQQLYVIDGHRISEPSVPRGPVTVDGQVDEPVWQTGTTATVGAYSTKTVEAQTAWTPTHLHLYARVTDAEPPASGASLDDEAVVLAVALDSLDRNAPVDGTFRVRVNATGAARLDAGRDGAWQTDEGAEIETAVSSSGLVTTPAFRGRRHHIEVRIPWSELGGRPEVGTGWGSTVGVIDDTDGRTEEYVGGTTVEHPAGWMRATLVERSDQSSKLSSTANQ